MKVIGITGGVGAGKSSVLALLKEMCSCDIIQADLVARNIYHSGNIGFKKVVDIFGEQIVGEDGEINRPLLADIIFKNPNKRIVLNSIIHPLVKQEIIYKEQPVRKITEIRIFFDDNTFEIFRPEK